MSMTDRSKIRSRNASAFLRRRSRRVLFWHAGHDTHCDRRGEENRRMMLDSVPNVSSAWSGTGTVVVVLPDRCCMTM